MRIVPLTPALPMVDPTGEGFRWDLFLAFKAASIVFCKIQADIRGFLQVPKDLDWPPAMTAETCRFPSVTEIDAFSNSQSEKIKFVLESRHDAVENRHLYHARLVSPISSDGAIYVKFSQRYSVDLHSFCVSQGLAPKILGFQQLSGGWFVVAMEKVDIVDPNSISSFPEAERWKTDIKTLVDGFHQKGLVHGDLRLANFVFTKSENPRRMLLVDFDWGGKEGEVMFPHGQLTNELGVSNNQLCYRPITKEHDRGCLSKVLHWLDRHTPVSPAGGGEEQDTMDSDQEMGV
jgi:thiamine kinase-like enzyme